MAEPKYTPGPWGAEHGCHPHRFGSAWHIKDAQGESVALLGELAKGPSREPDARLISAAPELAELWEPSDPQGFLWHLELACKVMRGENPILGDRSPVCVESLCLYLEQRAEAARKALEKAGVEVAHELEALAKKGGERGHLPECDTQDAGGLLEGIEKPCNCGAAEPDPWCVCGHLITDHDMRPGGGGACMGGSDNGGCLCRRTCRGVQRFAEKGGD